MSIGTPTPKWRPISHTLLVARRPPRYPHTPGDFHRHPETGAPYVAHPTETTKDGRPRRVMYGRPSSFGAALDNPFNLVKWKERQLLIGASYISPDDWFPVNVNDRDALDGLAARCHEAAGSSLAADRGTHIHLLLERLDKGAGFMGDLLDDGERLGIPRELQHRIMDQWIQFRARLGLTALAVEQTVVNDRWRLAGTLDRLDVADRDILTAYGILDAGVPFVGDIKTGGLTVGSDGQPSYWVKFAVQLAAYVDAVPYDTETDERGKVVWLPSTPTVGAGVVSGTMRNIKPNPHIALIYHYDLARALNGEPVDWQAIPVNVDAGREGGDLCRAAADFGKRRDLFAMPAPNTTPAILETDQPLTDHLAAKIKAEFAVPVPPVAVEQPAVDPEPDTASPPVPASAADRPIYVRERGNLDRMSLPSDPERLRNRIMEMVLDGHEQKVREAWPEGVPTLKHDGHTPDQLAQILAAVRRVESEVGAGWHPDDNPPPSPRAAISRALQAWEGRDPKELWFTASIIATFEQCANPDVTLEGLVGRFTIEQCERLWEAAGQ